MRNLGVWEPGNSSHRVHPAQLMPCSRTEVEGLSRRQSRPDEHPRRPGAEYDPCGPISHHRFMYSTYAMCDANNDHHPAQVSTSNRLDVLFPTSITLQEPLSPAS